MRGLNKATVKYIEDQPIKWHETYQKRVIEYRKKDDDFMSKICQGKGCEDLAKKIIIYNVASFPFYIQVVKESGRYKILDLYLRSD
jgi:hypothetical protein